MSSPAVIYSLTENIAAIEMDRPESLNSLSSELVSGLTAAIGSAVRDGARAAILTGRRRAFSSGGDIREMASILTSESDVALESRVEEPLSALHGLITAIRDAPMPFVAAVNGVCAGAGVNLALACDLVIAAEDAVFSERFAQLGLSPDCGGTFFLPRLAGEKLAAEILMAGAEIGAARAAELGLINRAVEKGSLIEEARTLAARIAAMPPAVISRIKRLIAASATNDLHSQLALEYGCQIESASSPEFREGVAAFLEKRAPRY